MNVEFVFEFFVIFFFKQKTAYDMRISDWSSDVCSSDLQTDWLDSLSASRSAAALADAENALEWAIEGLVAQFIDHYGQEIRLSRIDFPREIQRRLLLRMISRLEPRLKPRGDALDQALVQLALGKKYTMGGLLLQGGEIWTVKPAAPRRRTC